MRETFLILAAAAVVFGGALWAPFHLDDFALLQDPVITSPDGWWRSFSLGQTRPLTWLTFWLNYQLAGDHPAGYHLLNVVLHLANIAVLRVALARLIPASAATIATAIFALHPIQTEAVVYVFDRATLLMTLFCLLSLRAWNRGRHWSAAAWFVPALLAKEECVTFPLLLWLLDRRQRMPVSGMLALAAIAGLRVLHAANVTAGSGAGMQSGVSSLGYLLVQGAALARYLRLLVLPYGFSIESPIEPDVWMAAGGWVIVAAVAALAARFMDRTWVAAWLIVIAPASSVLPAADLSADRRMYLPMIAVAALAGSVLAKRPRWIAVSLVATLSLVSLRQTLVWRSGETLWREAVRLAPQKLRPRIQLARQVAPAEALQILNEAQRLAPENPAVASEKGRVLLEMGNPQIALSEFGRALALAPGDARAVNNRGVALLRLNQREAAIADFQRALSMEPCLFDARGNLYAAGVSAPPPGHCRYTPQQSEALRR